MNKKSRIIFFGTPDFAVPALQALIQNDHTIAAVVTAPDKPVGRKHILTPPPIKVLAEQHRIPILQPETLDSNLLADYQPDLFIVVAYGKVIPKNALSLPRLGALNIHPSLLPRWRGPSPIQYAILEGDAETGVTIMQIDEEVDHGPIVAQQSIALQRPTYPELHNTLAHIGAELLLKTIPKYLADEITPTTQNHSQATYSKILSRKDGKINWTHPAEKIERMVRAFTPWPGAWTLWNNARLKIEQSETTNELLSNKPAGTVWQDSAHPLLVNATGGSLVIKKLTLEGTQSMSAEEFVHGHLNIIGTLFSE